MHRAAETVQQRPLVLRLAGGCHDLSALSSSVPMVEQVECGFGIGRSLARQWPAWVSFGTLWPSVPVVLAERQRDDFFRRTLRGLRSDLGVAVLPGATESANIEEEALL
jgi:hypothetical protein